MNTYKHTGKLFVISTFVLLSFCMTMEQSHAKGGRKRYVQDEDVTINFYGSFLSESCDVDTNSINQTVHIGDFSSLIFSGTGSVSPSAPFDINLKNCGDGVQGTIVKFGGTSDSTNAALLALSDTGATGNLAKGVGIQIIDAVTELPVDLNKDSSGYVLKPGDNTLSFKLRYQATGSKVTAGNATGVMYFDLSYQ